TPPADTGAGEVAQPPVAAVEVEQAEPAPRAQRTRRPRAESAPRNAEPATEAGEETSRDAASLPGFVTRPVALEDTPDEAPAPRRRAPRRKVEETTSED